MPIAQLADWGGPMLIAALVVALGLLGVVGFIGWFIFGMFRHGSKTPTDKDR